MSIAVLEEDHTGAYLASKLTAVIAAWNIGSKVHVGVRDNAANTTRAMRIADMGCMAHMLPFMTPCSLRRLSRTWSRKPAK